jgi:hypothetical protein
LITAGFVVRDEKRFMLGINRLTVAEKPSTPQAAASVAA